LRPISFRSRGLRRALSSGIVAATALGMLGIAAIPAAADPAADRTVVSGQARFEVLSPTLIRTEYAGDSQFTDGSTFNVIGRDDFAPTTFTKTERDGWLTLDTGAMTVRYKEGSGAFTQDTLQTTVTTGSSPSMLRSVPNSRRIPGPFGPAVSRDTENSVGDISPAAIRRASANATRYLASVTRITLTEQLVASQSGATVSPLGAGKKCTTNVSRSPSVP